MNILAPETTCPSWCSGGHIPADNGVVHISVEQVLAVSAGRETGTVYVSVEQVEQPGAPMDAPSLRIEGAGSRPMTLAQAMHLAHVLQATVFAALTGGQVSR